MAGEHVRVCVVWYKLISLLNKRGLHVRTRNEHACVARNSFVFFFFFFLIGLLLQYYVLLLCFGAIFASSTSSPQAVAAAAALSLSLLPKMTSG